MEFCRAIINQDSMSLDPSNVIVFIGAYQPCDNDFDCMIFYFGGQKTYIAIQCSLN